MNKTLIVAGKILLALVGLFSAIFSVYLFNLDMKLMAYVVDPFLQKIYDSKKRKQYV